MGYKPGRKSTYKDFKSTPLQKIGQGMTPTRHDLRDVERQSFSEFPYVHGDVQFSEHALQHIDTLGADPNKLQEDLQGGLFNHILDIDFNRQDQPPQRGYVLEMTNMPNTFVLATNVEGELFVESVHDSPEYWSIERVAPPAVERGKDRFVLPEKGKPSQTQKRPVLPR